jgi:tetratricopeptide (TPR) repeat protein
MNRMHTKAALEKKSPAAQIIASPAKSPITPILLAIGLTVVTCLTYWRVLFNQFIGYDDGIYLYENPFIRYGITHNSLKWAFTTNYVSNWHPITWLSHLIDVSLFGMNPTGHHAVNLLIHILNTLILFFLLKKMTGSMWKSAFVAALFSLHPLHVQSVAWAAERKDLLSTFFGLLAIFAYVRYVERPGIGRYIPVAALFALGLMSKAMIVTLPILLLVLDYWPLGRVVSRQSAVVSAERSTGGASALTTNHYRLSTLIIEKIPLFVLSGLSGVMAYWAEKTGGAVSKIQLFSVSMRIDDLIVGYAGYLVKMVWPQKLAICYPPPGDTIPVWCIIASALALTAISALAVILRRKAPYFLAGWLWYVLALTPVIAQIMKEVGDQSISDRFTYVPLIGIFIIITWGISDWLGFMRAPQKTTLLAIVGGAVILALAVCSYTEVGYWKDSRTLYRRALAINPKDPAIDFNMGMEYITKDRDFTNAVRFFREALKANPSFSLAFNGLGLALAKNGHPDEAIEQLRTAIRLKSEYPEAHNNLGTALMMKRQYADAIAEYKTAIRQNPHYLLSYVNLGNAYVLLGKWKEAIEAKRKLAEFEPDSAVRHADLAQALGVVKDFDGSIKEAKIAARCNPKLAKAYQVLAIAYFYKQDYRNAWTNVHISEKLGASYGPAFISQLTAKLADPGS